MKRRHAEITKVEENPPQTIAVQYRSSKPFIVQIPGCGDWKCFWTAEGPYQELPWLEDVQEACADGDLETAKKLMAEFSSGKRCDTCPAPPFNRCLREACLGKHTDVVGWILTSLKTGVGFSGYPGCIDWHYFAEHDDLVANSAVLLEWLWNHADKTILKAEIQKASSDPSPREFFLSLANGYEALPAMQWFWDHGVVVAQRPALSELRCSDVYMWAEDKEIKQLRWLHQHNCVNVSKARIMKNGTVDLDPSPRRVRGSRLLIPAT